ncbi:PPE domain-containing protein [Mycobacterium leprae]|nr:PPE domain-containing protein [Mycobacterium leprae]
MVVLYEGRCLMVLVAVPILMEVAANYAIHAVLPATNFFGLDTILNHSNQDDYMRM